MNESGNFTRFNTDPFRRKIISFSDWRGIITKNSRGDDIEKFNKLLLAGVLITSSINVMAQTVSVRSATLDDAEEKSPSSGRAQADL